MRNQRVKVSTLGYGATKIGGARIYSNNFSGNIVALKKALFYYEGLSVRQSGFELFLTTSQIKYIKKFMKESLLEGFHAVVDWKDKRFAKQSTPTDSDALTVDQLKDLAEYDFFDSLVLDNARDFFLVGC